MAKTVGIALGGGGAKGLAHIPVLRVLDDLGVDVVSISGTSIGAIVGTMYAAGMSAQDIRKAIDELLAVPRSLDEARKAKRLFGWLDLLGVEFGRSHLLQAEGFIAELETLIGVQSFEELRIPLKVVAADFWQRSEVVFDKGPILPAVAASFCLPGIFKPVLLDGKVLVDGGCVNPVPFDLIRDKCDILIAVDVLGKRVPNDDLMPSYTDAIFNTFQIAEKTIVNQKLRTHTPDIYIEPAISDVKVLEFQKSEQIYAQTQPECERLARELEQLLAEP